MSSPTIACPGLRRRPAFRARPRAVVHRVDNGLSLGDFLQRGGETWNQDDGQIAQGPPGTQTGERRDVRSAFCVTGSLARMQANDLYAFSPVHDEDEETGSWQAERRQHQWTSVQHTTDSLLLLRRSLAIRERDHHSGGSEDEESTSDESEIDSGDENDSTLRHGAPAIGKWLASITESFESYITRSVTPSHKPLSQSARTTTLCSIHFDARDDLSNSPSRNHGTDKERVMPKFWAIAKRCLRRRIQSADTAKNKRLDQDLFEKMKRRRSFIFRLSPWSRHPIPTRIYMVEAKERLYAAPDSPTSSQYSSDEEDDGKEAQRESDVAHRTRSGPGIYADYGDGPGRWEGVKDDSMHGRKLFCFCLP